MSENRRTILALWNNPNTGKTETLRALANLFVEMIPNTIIRFPIPFQISQEEDFRLIIEINETIVGIESQGDPNTNLEDRLLELVNDFNCELIICATRLRGETVWAVENIHENFSYKTIWTSTYQVSDPNLFQIANQTKAQHIIDLIRSLQLF